MQQFAHHYLSSLYRRALQPYEFAHTWPNSMICLSATEPAPLPAWSSMLPNAIGPNQCKASTSNFQASNPLVHFTIFVDTGQRSLLGKSSVLCNNHIYLAIADHQFRVTAERRGLEHKGWKSPEAAGAIGAGIVEQFKWKVNLKVHAHIARPRTH
jgi:hypothetical protein